MASILSISSIKDKGIINDYLDYLGVKLRPYEVQTIKALCATLVKAGIAQSELDNFILGYSIKQISKEFDILRITGSSIVNIELKTVFDYDSALVQLQRNYYYLKSINSNASLFTFVGEFSKLYQLDPSGRSLVEVAPPVLIKALESQGQNFIQELDPLFDPRNYLVSPFNTTERFINQEYFLTNHQHEIKRSICNLVCQEGASIMSITGKAGTGKSLLIYDITREIQKKDKRTLVVHCGILNGGHQELNSHGFDIIPVKALTRILANSESLPYDVIVVDEAQRLKPSQTASLVTYHNANNTDLIFGYDPQQLLRDTERTESRGSLNIIETRSSSAFTLTDKIRSNANVANFIVALYDLTKKSKLKPPIENIGVVYFSNYSQASAHIKSKHNYTYIPFTPSVIVGNHHPIDMIARKLNTPLTAHAVIGQEFDNVIIVLDQHFFYSSEGKLRSQSRPGNVYSQILMLFQSVTRTKNKLEIVVVNNETLFSKIAQLLT